MIGLLKKITSIGLKFPKSTIVFTILLTIGVAAFIPLIHIDTDPENMLSKDEFVRVFHNDVKKTFDLKDIIVLGVVNDENPNGVFNKTTLEKVYKITNGILGIDGVVSSNLISPSTTDNIRQGGPGTVVFEWLMGEPTITDEKALELRDEALDNPMLYDTLVSQDGKALCVYVPVESKDISYRVSQEIKTIIDKFPGDEKFYITGLPVANDTFGFEMFKQMAISAPLAGLIIFLLMWYFFKKIKLIFSPMIVAMSTVLITMGTLIGFGFTVHIMSSMIPIFLMPIAVVDSVHILSEFFDRYQTIKDKKQTIKEVMNHLFVPMLFTSLTSAAGFASLAFTPIPPVQVFGVFVAFGILLAWFLTIVFIPAYVLMIPDKSLKNFGVVKTDAKAGGMFDRSIQGLGKLAVRFRWLVLAAAFGVVVFSVFGILKIQINDNPVKWFNKNHDIRIADKILNEHFGGTYTAYLIFEEKSDAKSNVQRLNTFVNDLESADPNLSKAVSLARTKALAEGEPTSYREAVQRTREHFEAEMDIENKWEDEKWLGVLDVLEKEENSAQTFKNPDELRYIEKLQKHLKDSGLVGKSTSASDLVKKVYYELMDGDKKFNVIPNTPEAVAQTYLSFQNSHKPQDLWHLVTPDYSKANIWLQLKSGDNQDMEKVERVVERFIRNNPPPIPVDINWAGLTYINTVWQEKMVFGMLKSLLGSFVIVAILMSILFRSVAWGLLSMIPLSITIAFIYGIIGWVGKDYDMPVAVLSSLTLGLSIDFAIHFIERMRTVFKEVGNLKETFKVMYQEPARAITRNAVVIAIGFTPLLLSPLVPYNTVGFFIAAIMAVSGLVTLLVLPSLICLTKKFLLKDSSDLGGKCE